MTPLHFGKSEKPLFGVHHEPVGTSVRDVSVLLCNPVGNEYMRSHWALRRLAILLCQAGFSTFRFDYFGTGDSFGESREGEISKWKEDIRIAADELSQMTAMRDLAIVGLRLGGSLAAAACSEGLILKDLVLWDPVVNGIQYVRELQGLHAKVVADIKGRARNTDSTELMGFPFPTKMKQGIETIDLVNCPPLKAERVFLVVSEERDEYHDLKSKLVSDRVHFEYSFVPDGNQWHEFENFYAVQIVNDILHEIVGRLASQNR